MVRTEVALKLAWTGLPTQVGGRLKSNMKLDHFRGAGHTQRMIELASKPRDTTNAIS